MSPSPQPADWYAILDVPASADAEAIKAAHLRRARELHPDINTAADATARMAEVNHARDILLDPVARALFDRERTRARVRSSGAVRRTAQRPTTSGYQGAAGPIKFTFDHGRSSGVTREAKPGQRPHQQTAPRDSHARWAFDPASPMAHDWYAFLEIPPWATANEIQAAIARRAPEATRADLPVAERAARSAKLRAAWEVLGRQGSRAAYDASRPQWQPQPGTPDFYRTIGVRPVASTETIGAAVARIARALGPKPIGEQRRRESAIREAWWVLRDPERRATYDKWREAIPR